MIKNIIIKNIKYTLNELYTDWFNNKNYWFSKKKEIDLLLCNKYYDEIEILINIKDIETYNFTKIELIGSIILLDQIPRHYKRLNENEFIDIDNYSKQAIKFSEIIIEKNLSCNIDELCFIYLPYRHINDIDNILKIINIFIDLHNKCNENEKIKCKKYIYNTINKIYKLININSYRNNLKLKNLDELNKDIFDKKSLIKYKYHYDNFKTDIYNKMYEEYIKLDKNSTIIVSLSGGVDSVVSLYILKLINNLHNNNIKIIAIHINYNNRETCKDELDFINYYCNYLEIKLIYRNIIEINRNQCIDNGLRNLYEDVTKKIRLDMYKYGYIYSNKVYVLLGHNKNDCFENIITNIINKKDYNNLNGMNTFTSIDNLVYWRPLLNIYKSEIIKIANNNNLLYLEDSTPKWSARGKIRDNLIPVYKNIKKESIESFFILKDYIKNQDKIINKYIINNLINKFKKDNNNYIAELNIDDLNLFKYLNLCILFFKNININVSFKSLREFNNYISKYTKDYKFRKFVLNKNYNIIIDDYNNKTFNLSIIFNNIE